MAPSYTWDAYPAVRRDEGVTVPGLPGTADAVPDHYVWLEDPDSDETAAFVQAQDKVTEAYLAQYEHKDKLEAALTKLWNYERYSCPSKEGDKFYYFHNSGLQPQSVLYSQTALDAEPEVFFDPNTLSEDGTVAFSATSFSESGTYFGYSVSKSGSDWVTIHVKRVADGAILDDTIEFAKFTSISWTKDEQGFFYTRYPKPEAAADLGTETDSNEFAQTMFHAIGTDAAEDILVYHDPDHPKYSGSIVNSDCGEYLILGVSASTAAKNLLWIARKPESVADLAFGSLEWTKIVDDVDQGSFEYLTNDATVFYFKSNWTAPRGRIVKYDLADPETGFVEIVPEHATATLSRAEVVNHDKLLLVYMEDVQDVLHIHDLTTGAHEQAIHLPTVGSVDDISAKRKDGTFFYKFSSFLSPGTIIQHDLSSGEAVEFKTTHVDGFDPKLFEATQEFYESKDGTRVPMFIVQRKGGAMDGSRPCLQYGYGGFNISLGPMFVPAWLAFIQHYDAVVAMPNLRGGGEYGEAWHEAGMLRNKQNVFDDFQWAAKHLVARGYTSHAKLAINGGSNGGLLIGACINQAPDLFGAAVAEVGVMDMVKYDRFTIGAAWRADYGDPNNPEDLAYLLTYSPVHTVKEQTYPATLVMTSDHDDRVVPLHSYKYISELQFTNPQNPNPLLILVEQKAGHGAGKPTKKRIESAANKFAFIAMNTGAEWRD
ncbi:hypothetical protein AMAG_11721 [Allomyces macrogynus ATCC 38327]|uniref:Prolyl endopeptidase n=1 Tax=Allomyces macrogynus (strain ATCC 38327) TaxID=578462 RepID=A0A0L0SVJ1_ALLM3|nr:hypothetical protein AMAG_11721 [Allomyces macrogynus ATCC 38327]|eukprot:KNE66603.1 hypothetical protein AMAG_11721 [Allomyces macrogynus ATCC 38327]